MKKTRMNMLAGLFALSVASISWADSIKLDPIHSMVVFQINHLNASNPFGIFHAVEGTVNTDGEGLPKLDLTVPVEKLDMGLDAWEKHIKSADFFNAKQFPNITFKSTTAKKTSDGTYEVTGDLTLHGVTKSITVTLTKGGEAKDPKGDTRVGYNTTFKIKRSDFDVKYGTGMIGDEVTLMVNIEGIKQ